MLKESYPFNGYAFISRAIVCLAIVLGAGCTHTKVLDLREGDASDAALLTSVETVRIESVDGLEVERGFIGQKYQFEISPGLHTVIVTYNDFFEYGLDQFETVSSGIMKVRFHAETGGEYRITHDVIETVEKARLFAKKPVIALVDGNNTQVDVDVEYSIPKSLLSKIRFQSEEEKVFASDYVPEASGMNSAIKDNAKGNTNAKSLSTLESLQAVWKEATSEEKEAFRKWINQ
ncbi:MAG: DUF2057 domain-containing protein [Pseudomonadales bacterium]|nr:DUF2057 domain-containing protein [Pseudomonadales bacterium]